MMPAAAAAGSEAHPEQLQIAHRLRSFGPLGVPATFIILVAALLGPLVSGALILVWATLSQTPLRDLGFSRPRNWAVTIVGAAAVGIVLKLVLKALVMPLLGAPPVNATYHYLAGNTAALPAMVGSVLISAGFGEELFFRGYLFNRIHTLLGRTPVAVAVAIVSSSAVFAVAHYPDQGLPGVEQAAVTGLVLGGLFAWQKRIWIPMIAHVAFDLAAVALIYYNVEEQVARSLFR
jgi:uncharacterized protein